MKPAIHKRELGSGLCGVRRVEFGRNVTRPTTGSMFGFPTCPQRGVNGTGKEAVTDPECEGFVRGFKTEMDVPTARQTWRQLVDRRLLRKNETRCHRSVLRELLTHRGADSRQSAAKTADVVFVAGQNSVPHGLRWPTYIPFVNEPKNEGISHVGSSSDCLSYP